MSHSPTRNASAWRLPITPSTTTGARLTFLAVGLLLLCAVVAIGAGLNLCPLHKKQMSKKKIDVVLLVCRHNQAEWQQYTNARARLFPKSCDELHLDAGEVTTMSSKQLQKKYGWKQVPKHISISVCPACDERKGKWLAEHPPKTYKKDEIPPP